MADGLGARLVLFVVPTLDLAVQTALAWRRDGHGEHMVIVSSLDTAGRDDLVAARIMSTTDPHALGGLMSVVADSPDNGKLRLERASLPHATAMGEGRFRGLSAGVVSGVVYGPRVPAWDFVLSPGLTAGQARAAWPASPL